MFSKCLSNNLLDGNQLLINFFFKEVIYQFTITDLRMQFCENNAALPILALSKVENDLKV